MLGWRVFKWDRVDLKNNAKQHGAPMSILLNGMLANYLNLNKVQQSQIVKLGDWDYGTPQGKTTK